MTQQIKSYLSKYLGWRWDFGFIENGIPHILDGSRVDIKYAHIETPGRWFADPFIVACDEKEIVILCEEMAKGRHLGRIARLVFSRQTYELLQWEIVLELPTHLSFPSIIHQADGSLWVHPENAQSGNHTIYRYDDSQKSFTEAHIICHEPLVDAVFLRYDGADWLFATRSNNATLYAYTLQSGEFILQETIDFENSDARRAGNFFEYNGHLYSPAQDCSKTYGGAVIIQEVHRTNGHWTFNAVRTLHSTHPTMNFGMHTLNCHNCLVVVDVKGFEHPRLVRTLKFLQKLVRRF